MTTQGEAKWRYEVRGSGLWDNREQRSISNAEAGEILNAHEALLLKEGVWAAKAGLATGQADALERRAEQAEANLRVAVEALRTMLVNAVPVTWFGKTPAELLAQLEAMDPQSSTPGEQA